MSNHELSTELMKWFRIGRNENGLHGDERKYFRAVCNEFAERGLMDRSNRDLLRK